MTKYNDLEFFGAGFTMQQLVYILLLLFIFLNESLFPNWKEVQQTKIKCGTGS